MLLTMLLLLGVSGGLDLLDEISMDTNPSESDSSPPSWDESQPGSAPDDLSELSIQTDQFAQKHTKSLEPGTHHSNISPDGLTSSSCSSSYSSIVSSSSGEGANGKNKGDKRYPVGFTPFGDGMQGPLTPRTSPPLSSGGKRNAWGTASSPSTPDPVSGFGLQTIQETSRPGNTLTDSQAGVFNQSFFGLNVPSSTDSSYGLGTGISLYSSQDSSLTMMQKLQMERRRRIKEHQSRLIQGEDWPGFDVPFTRNESLWDSEYNPMDPNNGWSMAPDTPPAPESNGLWSSLTSSANNSWNQLMGIWGGSVAQTTVPDPLISQSLAGVPPLSVAPPLSAETSFSSADGSASINTSMSTGVESLPAFNPFTSDIWSPSVSVASSSWNLPSSQAMHKPDDKLN